MVKDNNKKKKKYKYKIYLFLQYFVSIISIFFSFFLVNVFGHVNLSRTLLPLLRSSNFNATKRILFTSSLGGLVTPAGMYMYMCADSSTKYSLESIGNGFRMELKKWNFDVILIEPGLGAIENEFSKTFQNISNSLEKQIETSNQCQCEDEILQNYFKSMNEFKNTTFSAAHVSLVTNSVRCAFFDC
jgi:NAD(P)-dependent dehydrogenase (short-subunit alcohol dehydrogenase family)